MAAGDDYRALGERAWAWVLDQVGDDDGPWLPGSVTDGPPPGPADDRDSLYAGIAGLAPVLAEIAQHRELTDAERALSAAIVTRLAAAAATRAEPSLYDGLAGDATALKLLVGDSQPVALRRLAQLATPMGWKTTFDLLPGSDAPLTDVVLGSAGIVMAAVWAGGEHAEPIAITGGEALLRIAEPTGAGLNWGMIPGKPSKSPNFSHGTAGVAAALAVAGTAFGRPDFVEAARQGALELLDVGSLDGGGFIIPHTIPPSTREVEPLTYTWCHGPTGTSYAFAALSHAGVDEVGGLTTAELRQRCLHSLLTSGIPQRLRPGFWDNDGRCCGTAGVGDALLDAVQDDPGSEHAAELLAGARTMADALVERAVVDGDGARWRFIEYRQDEPLLPPGTSWMQGAAGIAAYLFRLGRVLEQGLGAKVVDRPDQWWGVPAALRTVHN
ncbi:lantibiotic modifying enzyme [Allocatelliglobosispora scoriae]|uniref:Lantibiotic modifying enzyme n=1 Tax=Allocatelliglobosispora scoriae TaxID=643052 RepID=A0A841C1C3_9ACTN|nr:lanthionine synthetase LanC family protein [Allocatelliglobosispora scoriae]MBB5872770.1 lantibiotic modifying enzyme [Allocatelliglobosispora scoriae]